MWSQQIFNFFSYIDNGYYKPIYPKLLRILVEVKHFHLPFIQFSGVGIGDAILLNQLQITIQYMCTITQDTKKHSNI